MTDDILPIEFVDLKKQRARIGDKIDAAIAKVLNHGQFILGPEVKQLEEGLKTFCGAKHAIACSNGTDAIGLSLMALKVRPGQAIMVPAFTFAATAEVVAWLGATPVFVDSDPDTFNMDPASLEEAIKTAEHAGLKPVGAIAVDLFGMTADYDAIEKICDQRDMWVIADSAQGFGAQYKGRVSGSIGKLATTSFFPAKPLGCYGDGGAIFTNDDELAATLQSLRFHGKGEDKYDNVRIGMNARLDTVQAGILLEKLAIYADEIEKRNLVAENYTRQLSGVVKTPVIPAEYLSVWAQYTLTLDAGTDRAKFQADLKAKGVPTNVYYPKPLHRQTAYSKYPVAGNGLPVCEDLAGRVVSLPMHPYLTEAQINHICAAVKDALKNPQAAAA